MWPFSRRQPKPNHAPIPPIAPKLPAIQPVAAILPHPDPDMASKHREIIASLARLQACHAARTLFGALGHAFKLNPPVSEAVVANFESTHQIRLPDDYRSFLIHVGNGGAGPAYGVFKLQEMDDGHADKKWTQGDGFVGTLAAPFPHNQPWNDLSGRPADPDDQAMTEEQEQAQCDRLDEWESSHYWNSRQVNGAIPLCDMGCALRQWLVISGDEAGHVWNDFRADERGLSPVQIGSLQRVTFLQWYQSWLDDALKQSGL